MKAPHFNPLKKTLFKRLFAIAAVVIFSYVTLHANEEDIVTMEGNKLVGLPAKYAPAELDLKEFRIRIKNHSMDFSPFLKSLFPDKALYDLTITTSCHGRSDPTSMPPTIILHIQPKGEDHKNRDYEYSIVFNLETLEVKTVYVILHEGYLQKRYLPIELSKEFKRQISESIKTIE